MFICIFFRILYYIYINICISLVFFLLIKRRDTIHYFLKIYFFDIFDVLDMDSLTKLYICIFAYDMFT